MQKEVQENEGRGADGGERGRQGDGEKGKG